MMAIITDLILILFGLFFIYTGVTSFTRPKQFAAALGLQIDDRSGTIEIHAQYGGFFFAAGVSQLLPLGFTSMRVASFAIGLTIFGGLIAGRLMSLWLTNASKPLLPTIRTLFWVDGLGALLATLGLLLSVQI